MTLEPTRLDLILLPGARELLAAHARELPQRDDLCGAFCGALALHAAGIDEHDSEPLDQDAVALAAGSVVSALADPGSLPFGEQGRRDYRLELPFIEDASRVGHDGERAARRDRGALGPARSRPSPTAGRGRR